MNFDQYGHLTPYELIETDLLTFEKTFVTDFEPFRSTTRRPIFEAYLQYVAELRQIVGGGFYQWIDGSFVTQKLNPKDVDFVTFIDLEQYQQNAKEIEKIRWKRYTKNIKTDGSFVIVYPDLHKQYGIYKMEQKRWLFDFSTHYYTKRPKGVIELYW